MDARLRELERRAKDDPAALAELRRERERAGLQVGLDLSTRLVHQVAVLQVRPHGALHIARPLLVSIGLPDIVRLNHSGQREVVRPGALQTERHEWRALCYHAGHMSQPSFVTVEWGVPTCAFCTRAVLYGHRTAHHRDLLGFGAMEQPWVGAWGSEDHRGCPWPDEQGYGHGPECMARFKAWAARAAEVQARHPAPLRPKPRRRFERD